MKAGDIVELTPEGVSSDGHWFKDGVYTNLEVHGVYGTSIAVWQHDKTQSWMVMDKHLRLVGDTPSDDDPSTWKRNKPLMVKITKIGQWKRRHFAYYEDGKVHIYTNGYTSYTHIGEYPNGEGMVSVHEWRLPTKEELK